MLVVVIKTLLVALTGGFVFHFFQVPLAWMLGSLTAVMLWSSFFKGDLYWPMELRNAGLIIVGYIMGISFTVETGQQIFRQLPAMLFSTIAIVVFSLLMGYLIFLRVGIKLPSSVIGSVPGGLSQMVVLSEEIKDADITVVTFMQTVRLLSVVFIVPFVAFHSFAGQADLAAAGRMAANHPILIENPGVLFLFAFAALAGSWIGVRVNLPMPFILGPLLGVIMLILLGLRGPLLPSILIIGAQLSIGTHLGLTIRPANLKDWKKLLSYTFIGSIGIVIFSFIIGYLLTYFYPISLITAFLSTAPGGMTEMGLTAVMLQADLSTVTAYQLFRVFFILFIVPPLLKWWIGTAKQEA